MMGAVLSIPGTGYTQVEELLAKHLDETFVVEDEDVPPPLPWRDWLRRYFPRHTSKPFGQRHIDFWEWVTRLRRGERPPARVEVWPRGGAKSTTIELALTYLGAQDRPVRNYALYVSETQSQANKHVSSIAGNFERLGVGRATNQYGQARGWRRAEIRTSTGFNITAFGLDSGLRGVKLDEYRPDIIIFDDIDGRHDTPAAVQKKIDVITETILPAGSGDVAVVIVQNKVHKDSIVSKLADGTADFLYGRDEAVVEPAVRGLVYERTIDDDGKPRFRIVAGEPTWAGQDLQTCEDQLNDWGVVAFEREAQHNVDLADGGLWDKERDIEPFRVTTYPELDRLVVAIDPNAGGADEAGIIVAGISEYYNGLHWQDWHGYVLADRTVGGGPKEWAEAAVRAYNDYRADALIAEANNGGEMVRLTIGSVPDAPPVELVWASQSKKARAEPVQKLYTDGRIHHLGIFPMLENELCGWDPATPGPSPNRLDALVWAFHDLLLGNEGGFDELDAYQRRVVGR